MYVKIRTVGGDEVYVNGGRVSHIEANWDSTEAEPRTLVSMTGMSEDFIVPLPAREVVRMFNDDVYAD